VLLLVVVVAGAIGVFGVHSSTVSARANGYLLSVTYARAARPGLDIPFTVRAQHTGSFPSSITLAVSTDYFRMFETQGFYPDADSATNDGPLTHGAALVIVDHGEPVLANLKAERVSIEDLMAAARSEGIERFADVRLAVLEANGRISFFTGHEESGASETPTVG
jgi:YetF C-terminal domain